MRPFDKALFDWMLPTRPAPLKNFDRNLISLQI
jgi:hypothetical protein